MTDDKLEQIRKENIQIAELILKALAEVAGACSGSLYRHNQIIDLIEGLPKE